MKKLTLSIFAAFFLMSFIPTQSKASTGSNPSTTTETANISSGANTDIINEIKPIDTSVLNSSETEETLKETSPVKDIQDEHSKRYNNRHQHDDVDVVVTAGHDDGYNNGRHGHSGAYMGIGGVLVIVLILVLIL